MVFFSLTCHKINSKSTILFSPFEIVDVNKAGRDEKSSLKNKKILLFTQHISLEPCTFFKYDLA